MTMGRSQYPGRTEGKGLGDCPSWTVPSDASDERRPTRLGATVTIVLGWWLAWATAAGGAPRDVSIRAVELVGGLAKAHRWMTVHVALENHGAAEMTGRLVAYGKVVEPGHYSRAISLPPASRFRVQLHLRALRSGILEVALECAGEVAAYHQVSLALVPDERRLVLVVDRETRRLPFLVPRNPDDSPRVKIAMGHVVPDALPDHWIGHDAFDVVALHDVVASALSDRQRKALLAWVRSGGNTAMGSSSSSWGSE